MTDDDVTPEIVPMVIGGISVDPADPCAVADALRRVRLQVAVGGNVLVTRFDEDEVRFGAANLAALDRLIRDFEGECAVKTGMPVRRRRYAKRLIFR